MTAGRLVALLYLFCVLLPSVALAASSGPTPCWDEVTPALAVHAHDALPAEAHAHTQDAPAHHHDIAQHRHADAAGGHAGHDHRGMTGPGACCALMCVSAIPANLPLVVDLSQLVSACVSEAFAMPVSEAPARVYRPPIV